MHDPLEPGVEDVLDNVRVVGLDRHVQGDLAVHYPRWHTYAPISQPHGDGAGNWIGADEDVNKRLDALSMATNVISTVLNAKGSKNSLWCFFLFQNALRQHSTATTEFTTFKCAAIHNVQVQQFTFVRTAM